jgi:hypothetical protein
MNEMGFTLADFKPSAVPRRENEMNPSSAREKLAVIQKALFLKKQEVIRKNAEIAKLTVELEDLHRRIAALQNRPTNRGTHKRSRNLR